MMKIIILILCCCFSSLHSIREKINLSRCDYSAMYNFGNSNSNTQGIYAAFYPIALRHEETYFHRPLISKLCQFFIYTSVGEKTNLPPCDYSAIYNFGDSNSETGGMFVALTPTPLPHGEAYFGRPEGRFSDGRVIIDFIAEELGMPYLHAYLDSVGTNFRRGANFATGGSNILKHNRLWTAGGPSPFSIEIQVEQYTQFRDRSAYLYGQTKDECIRKTLPIPEKHSSKAIFTIDIGNNDMRLSIEDSSSELRNANIHKTVAELIAQVEVLYERGARTFWIHNLGPIGCVPFVMALAQNLGAEDLDEAGCVKVQNELTLMFNNLLKEEIVKLRAKLFSASIVYVDMYAVKYKLTVEAKNEGFEDPFTVCCGYVGKGYYVKCGEKGIVHGKEVTAGSCDHPTKVISWDGAHYSDAANRWVASRILDGSFSDPPIGISRACHK